MKGTRATHAAEGGKREDLVRTAARLFCAHGIHAVGIDWIIEEAGVAKATLYKHFTCKDDLVVAALSATGEASRGALVDGARKASQTPLDRLLALPKLVARSSTHGCIFALAAQEFPDRTHAVHRESAAHRQALHAAIEALVVEAGIERDRAAVATEIHLVLDGVLAAVAVGPADARRAVEAATRLLRQSLRVRRA